MNVDSYFRTSAGLDYHFRSGFYAFAEYHYSSAGEKRAENYLRVFESPAFRDGSVYLTGRHYLGTGITRQITGLISATGFWLINLMDGSMSLSPRVEYNIAANVYVEAGACIGTGPSLKMPSDPLEGNPVRSQSEFGAYPDMVFGSFRVYF
ncbi:MAG TPA: hypothetical protein ENN03_10345 [bacterium]|nr:hypothetical protein [bacterium]